LARKRQRLLSKYRGRGDPQEALRRLPKPPSESETSELKINTIRYVLE